MKQKYGYISLGESAKFIRGITFKPDDLVSKDADEAVVCMRTKNVQLMLDESDLIAVPPEFVRRQEQYLITGDMLVSTANSWNLVGKCCWVPALKYKTTAGGFISILRANDSCVFPRYLYHWASSDYTQHLLRHCGRQTTNISNLNITRAEGLKVPIPYPHNTKKSLSEQKHIAAILDQADAIRKKCRQAIEELDSLVPAIFYDQFGSIVNNTRYPEKTIGELACIGTGKTPSRKIEEYFIGTIPWVKTTEVNGGVINDTEEKISDIAVKECGLKIFPKNSILIALYGQGKTRGRSSVLGVEATTNQACAIIQPSPRYNTDYLFSFLQLSYDNLRDLGRGGNQPNLNLNIIRNFPILYPSLNLQNEYSIKMREIQKLKADYEKSFNEADDLFNSLVQRAFKGEL